MSFEERFEVGDKVCGVIGYCPTYDLAWDLAEVRGRTHKECGDISIYDRMAHKGDPEIWSHDGRCLHVKGKGR